MSLLLCRQEPVKHPYYFEGLGINLYSSQELCYVIYNHPILVLDGFVDGHLVEFIREELNMGFLALKLEKWQQSGEDQDELLFLILQECDYYTTAEVSRFRQQIGALRRLTPPEYLKARGDYLFKGKQYGKAVAEYERILDLSGEEGVDDGFLAKVYNNLGASYARLFLTEKACQAYQRSFELARSTDVLKRIYYLSKWNPSLVPKNRLQALIAQDLKEECETEMEAAMEASAEADSLKELDRLFSKDPIKRLSGAGDLVKSWKQEYRNMI